jgi:tripartite-type tricarboxylate transporter receptor subunit TctC
MVLARVAILSVGLMVLGSGVGFGQDPSTGSGQAFPNKPIRIVTAGAGGGNDFMARLIAQAISGLLGQPVIVDNRAGDRPVEIVSKAPPDGHTLLLDGGSFWIGPLLRKTSYRSQR